jgi:hypothetical protein
MAMLAQAQSLTTCTQITARDHLLDHMWADTLAALRSLGCGPASGKTSPAVGGHQAPSGGPGPAGCSGQDWESPHWQERCLRSMAELKAALGHQQVCCYNTGAWRLRTATDASFLACQCFDTDLRVSDLFRQARRWRGWLCGRHVCGTCSDATRCDF